MRKSQYRRIFGIVLVVAGCLSSLLLYGQTATPPTSSLQPGPYYALVIGIKNYKYLPPLTTPIDDANDVARLLHDQYGFKVNVLLDSDRDGIVTALDEYRRTLPEHSNLLIYYAGHGYHDRDTDEAYWLPVNAKKDSSANWISADDITSHVHAIPSAHVLIISDSCYSGAITQGDRDPGVAINPQERSAYLAKMLERKSRNLMASGGDEPVADNGAPGHSIFAWAILNSLRQIEQDNFAAGYLFYNFVQPGVGGRSRQLPQYSWIRDSDHRDGDFVFSRVAVTKGGLFGWKCTRGSWRFSYSQGIPVAKQFGLGGGTARYHPAHGGRGRKLEAAG